MKNLRLTEKQAKVLLYWIEFGTCASRSNYEIAKERCKDMKSSEGIEWEREERDMWRYHTATCPVLVRKLLKITDTTKL